MIGKMDSVWAAVRDHVANDFGAMSIGALMLAGTCLWLAEKYPSMSATWKKRARLMRYCGNCAHADLYTETCAINADVGEKCALIDKTAGKNYTVSEE